MSDDTTGPVEVTETEPSAPITEVATPDESSETEVTETAETAETAADEATADGEGVPASDAELVSDREF